MICHIYIYIYIYYFISSSYDYILNRVLHINYIALTIDPFLGPCY